MKKFSLLSLVLVNLSFAVTDVPNAMLRTADSLAPLSYELVLTPQYVVSKEASFFSAELRYQPSEDLSVGFGFGSGEVGYNAGAFATWHIMPDLAGQPGLAVLGGMYFNHLTPDNYFVLKVAPTLSETFALSWGQLTPYFAAQVSPSFRLSEPMNRVALRATGGTQIAVDALRGLNIWTEVGINVSESFDQVAIGLSYPFVDLGA